MGDSSIKMTKRCTMCTNCCSKSKGYLNMKPIKVTRKPYHFIMVAATIVALLAYFIRDIKPEGKQFHYMAPNKDHLDRTPSSFISGVEFQQAPVRDHMREMAWQMDYACEASGNDVVFSFQYQRDARNNTYNDHVFMMCESHRCFGNTEIISESKEKILCTEEYGGELRKKKRSANITIKGIDINKWETIQYQSENEAEACMLGHAVDILNIKW